MNYFIKMIYITFFSKSIVNRNAAHISLLTEAKDKKILDLLRGGAEVSSPGSYPGGRGVRFPPPLPNKGQRC